MLDKTHLIIAGSVLLSMIGIAYGGYFLTTVARKKLATNELQRSFFRAGHAHAGVLVILGLIILMLTQGNGVAEPFSTLSLGVLIAAILMPAGFFLSVIGRDPQRPGRLIALLWVGAGALVVGLLAGGIGLVVAGASA